MRSYNKKFLIKKKTLYCHDIMAIMYITISLVFDILRISKYMKKENWEFIRHIFVSNFLTSEVFCKKEKYVLENFMNWEIFYGTHTIEVGKFQSWEFLWEFKVGKIYFRFKREKYIL